MRNPDPSRRRLSPGLFAAGLLGCVIAIGAAAVLAADHLEYVSAPGCGDDSGCAKAAASPWGKVPGVGFPVSFVGLAYFAAMVAAWIGAIRAGGVWAWLRWVARLGFVGSVLFCVVMVFGGYLCPYCVAVHAGNLVLLVAVELAPAAAGTGLGAGLAPALGLFVVVTGAEAYRWRATLGELDAAAGDSTRAAIEASRSRPQQPRPNDGTRKPFTGRYRIGPEVAPVRIVVFSDYQCPECRLAEAEIREILASRDDVSFSPKHFPMSTACNEYMAKDLHANACRAARAAETAGLLRGEEGFFQLHHLLFDRGGSFTDAELIRGLQTLGYDAGEFTRLMQDAATLELVRSDIDEAMSLGIHTTPLIFLNGVELRGWTPGRRMLQRAVEQLAASVAGPGTAEDDRPMTAAEKVVEDWRAQQPVDVSGRFTRGPADAAVQVVIWGDYQEPNCGKADRCVRDLLDRYDLGYTFRQYPVNQACNPVAPRTLHEQACLAAQAARSAGTLGGADGFWAMHEYLMANQGRVSPAGIREAATRAGLDADALVREMADDRTTIAINRDARAAWRIGMKSIPLVFVNGKLVPRWSHQKQCVLERIVAEAEGS